MLESEDKVLHVWVFI